MTNKDITAVYFSDLYDFSCEESVQRLCQENQKLVIKEEPMFSFMMCVYNDTSLFNSAVNSLLKQSYTNWELLILDNSDQNVGAWEMIQNCVRADPRIRAYKSEQNVGWAKGASILLKYIKGKYTSFLAADDCINSDVLGEVYETIVQEHPDVIWVGVCISQTDDCGMGYRGQNIPEYRVYHKDNRAETIYTIMRGIYYNSFYHYMKVSFLKENGIDFFEPYYADNAGMTRAMVCADKMVMLNKLVYFLTFNTTQTRGRYIWGSYKFMYGNQWRSIREVFVRNAYKNVEHIRYVAARILNNLITHIAYLCQGYCRDKYMNTIEKGTTDIIRELEDCLASDEVAEMLQIADAEFFLKLLDAISCLPQADITVYEASWLYPCIFLSFYRQQISAQKLLKVLIAWVLHDNNPRSIGFSYCVDVISAMEDSALAHFYADVQKLINKYDNYSELLLFFN